MHNFDTSMSHMLKGFNRDGCYMWAEMLTLSRTHDFTPIGEFMISPIHYIFITEFVSLICQSGLYLRVNMLMTNDGTYINTYIHAYIYTYIHTYIHDTYIHTYMHTYIHICSDWR